MIGVNELGTDPQTLDAQLPRVLDVGKITLLYSLFQFIFITLPYAWEAVVLVDQADIFL